MIYDITTEPFEVLDERCRGILERFDIEDNDKNRAGVARMLALHGLDVTIRTMTQVHRTRWVLGGGVHSLKG